jgi:DNA-binding MarR family transcriptional regulator
MSSLTTPTTGARRAAGRREASAAPTAVEKVDSRYLESLIGYNARRAALAVINVFLERMAVYELRPVDFSALSLIHHNPGITSRQLCGALGVLPPNLVGMINRFEKRGLVMRRPHPNDGRAQGLHLTDPGATLMAQAECTAAELEESVASRLSEGERKTLMALLQKIYL